jgi:hypothetical protein
MCELIKTCEFICAISIKMPRFEILPKQTIRATPESGNAIVLEEISRMLKNMF